MSAAAELLDRVQHSREVGRFDVEAFRAALAEEPAVTTLVLGEVGALLDGLRELLPEIERFTSKCMRIVLMQDRRAMALPEKLRNWVVAMVGSFAADVAPLGERIRSSMARLPSDAQETAVAVEEAALLVLTLRAALHQAVGERARGVATDALAKCELPTADAARLRARLICKELELVAADPRRLAEGSFDDRLRALPPLPEEPERRGSRFDLLEVD